MIYRDDYEALAMRADALERELAEAKHDHPDIDALRAQLADAQRELDRLRGSSKPPPKKGIARQIAETAALYVGIVVAAGAVLVGAMVVCDHPTPPILPGHVDGTLFADGPDIGTWQTAALTCYSRGDRFAGIDAFLNEDARLRYVLDAHGMQSIVVWDVHGRGVQAFANDCKTLRGSLEPTPHPPKRTQRVWLDGNVTFDCTTSGGHVRGTLTFTGCH